MFCHPAGLGLPLADFPPFAADLYKGPLKAGLMVQTMIRIERKSTLTPVSGCVSPGLLCVEVVDRKLKDYIALGDFSFLMHSDGDDISVATTAVPSTRVPTVSPTTTAAPSLPCGNRISTKRKRRQKIRDSIGSRLPARSRTTTHRRLHTIVARHLPPRTANPATYNRTRTRTNSNRNTRLKT